MPKLKTKKGVKKRFSFTKKHKIKFDRANKGHLKQSKNSKRKRKLRRAGVVTKADAKTIRTFLPYQ